MALQGEELLLGSRPLRYQDIRQWRIGVAVQKLLDNRGDTFPFGNPFSIRTAAQHTPPRPRTISLTLNWAFGE